MLADESGSDVASGRFMTGLQRPRAWLNALSDFIADQLPLWRDRSDRPIAVGETHLTSQLCAHLNSTTRKSAGWDILQFRTEEPDEVRRARRIDLIPAPSGEAIWIEGRRYSDFDTLLPIECKRLPTPAGGHREKREYLHTHASTTGGVQRFKAGHHGAGHNNAVIIGYIQRGSVDDWSARLDRWICAFVRAGVSNWDLTDRLSIIRYDASLGIGVLRSEHRRPPGYAPITLRHLWIERV
jgi:hypothetical protein